MANLYNTSLNNYSSSTSPQEPDDISLFLQQILLRSTSSSSSFPQPEMAPGHAQISGLNSFASFSFTAANVSSSSVGNPDNEKDDCDYESEEGVEALVEGTAAKPTPLRSCSKRSRAAEVHNQSEKRRRSRINEKMKALQNLIPNSNKTDKASMLDEAIEYLKQLQIQVQMLTMRNGLSLYPICLPGMLQPNQTSQMRMDVYDTDKLEDMNMAKAFCMDQNISTPVTDFSHMIGSKSSMELEPSVEQQQFGAFQLSGSTKGICKETVLSCRPLIEGRSTSNSGAKATCSIPCETQTSNLKKNILEACQGGDDHLLPNFINNPIFSTHLNI